MLLLKNLLAENVLLNDFLFLLFCTPYNRNNWRHVKLGISIFSEISEFRFFFFFSFKWVLWWTDIAHFLACVILTFFANKTTNSMEYHLLPFAINFVALKTTIRSHLSYVLIKATAQFTQENIIFIGFSFDRLFGFYN